MNFKEYIVSSFINTPVEIFASKLRSLTNNYDRIRYPELKELFAEHSRLETALTRIINNPMNCIDIGAHLGSITSTIKKLSPDGKHIAIEPIPYKCKWLKQKFPDVKVLQIALSDTVGEVEFFLQPQRSAFSGLRLHNNNNSSITNLKVEILKVNCQRLDDIVPSDLPIGFIKIDVEGCELAVLRGGIKVILKDQPTILFECTITGLKSYNISIRDIYNFFESYSYSIFLVKDWLGDGKALSYEQLVKAMQYPFQAFNFLAVPKKR